MVPAHSVKVSRVLTYSGYCHVFLSFVYGSFTLFGLISQNNSTRLEESFLQSKPRYARTSVWALPRSLAATCRIDFSFSSSGYLDVSVHRVPLVNLWIQLTIHEVCSCGFPHSDICGYIAYLQLPAAFRSLSRLSSALSAKASALRSSLLYQVFVQSPVQEYSRLAYRVYTFFFGYLCLHVTGKACYPCSHFCICKQAKMLHKIFFIDV